MPDPSSDDRNTRSANRRLPDSAEMPTLPDLCPECGTDAREMVMQRGDEWVCSWCDHVYTASTPAAPSRMYSTCECATSQIKPAWDRHGELVCEDLLRTGCPGGQNVRTKRPPGRAGMTAAVPHSPCDGGVTCKIAKCPKVQHDATKGDLLRDLCQQAIDLRHTLYYGIPYDRHPDLNDAANTLGGVLAKMERLLLDVT